MTWAGVKSRAEAGLAGLIVGYALSAVVLLMTGLVWVFMRFLEKVFS